MRAIVSAVAAMIKASSQLHVRWVNRITHLSIVDVTEDTVRMQVRTKRTVAVALLPVSWASCAVVMALKIPMISWLL